MENDGNEIEITRPFDLEDVYDNQGNTIFSQIEIGAPCSFEIKTEKIAKNFGLTFFRIRNVKLQIIAPNYDGIFLDAMLTLENNILQIDDNRAIQNRIGVTKSATSIANYDFGKFDFDFKNERYSPFEGAGLDSKWTLMIFPNNNKLTKSDITKVVLYIKYTARNN